jgi:hypothetical protein
VLVLAASLVAPAPAARANPAGLWWTKNNGSIIKVAPCAAFYQTPEGVAWKMNEACRCLGIGCLDDDTSAAKRGVTPRGGALLALTQVLAWLVLAAAQLALRPAFALDAADKPNPSFMAPLPPVRPAGPAGARATIDGPQAPTPSAAPIEAPTPQRHPPPPPRNLPPTSRARMHACGLEWQKMKETGAAADKIWLDFARICLAK